MRLSTYFGRHWKNVTIKFPGMINTEESKDSVHYLYLTIMLIYVLGIVKITIKRKINDDWFYSELKFVLALSLLLLISAHDNYYLYKVVAACFACILYVYCMSIYHKMVVFGRFSTIDFGIRTWSADALHVFFMTLQRMLSLLLKHI